MTVALTKAEETFVAGYGEALDWLPANDDREPAIAHLREQGFPTRRVESWHYTDLRARLREGFRPSARPLADDVRDRFDGTGLAIADGYLMPDLSAELPAGIELTQGLDGLPLSAEWSHDDVVEGLNAAFATDGLMLNVMGEVAEPVRLHHVFAGPEGHMAAFRTFVHVAESARATFVEVHESAADRAHLLNHVTRIKVADNAEVTWIVAGDASDAASRLGRLSLALGENSRARVFVLNAGGKLVRQEVFVDIVGETAHLSLDGINLVGGEAHVDVTTKLDHRLVGGVAEETFRNVCTDRGTGVFQGQIKVAQAAQQTDARMACNTLLLSDECEFNAKPELEIFADDVQCAHGATVADLEESYLFYLRSRGIPENEARRMLIRAFVAEVMEDLPEDVTGALDGRIDSWMERHI